MDEPRAEGRGRMNKASTVGQSIVRLLVGGPGQQTPGDERHDIAGFVLGAPILLAGIPLALNGPGKILYFVWGASLLLTSLGLFTPGSLYRWWPTRAIGFAAAVLAAGVAAGFAVLAGFCAQWLVSDPGDEWALLGVFLGAAGLAGFGYALACTVVLFKKLELETPQIVATIAAGIGVGALNIMLMYLLHCSPFFD
jgi:hypothetical protein